MNANARSCAGRPVAPRLVTRPFDGRGVSGWAIVLLVLLLILSVGGCFGKKTTSPEANGTTSEDPGESEAALTRINEALAATENLETEQAAKKWDQLHTEFPESASIALDRALNAVLRVDQLTAAATDSVKSQEEKKAARQQLPDAIDAADQAVKDYAELSGDSVTGIWLASRVDSHQATLLGATISKSLRRELFKTLTTAINQSQDAQHGAAILGGPLIELLEKMSDPVEGLSPEILKPATEALTHLSDQNEDNLFLAVSALRLAIDSQSPEASELVTRTWDLARAVEPTLAAYTKPIGVTPKELTDQIKDAIEASDWAQANQYFTLWSNVLNPLEIVRTDRRRASPHPLDRLSFQAVRKLSAEISAANPIAAAGGDTWVEFKGMDLQRDAVAVLPLDADLDLTMDLITASSDGTLDLLQLSDGQWETTATLKLDAAPAGLTSADLFMVDSSNADRIKRSNPVPAQGDTSTQDYSQKARHNSLPSLIAYGAFGIRLIQIDTRETTEVADRLTVVEKETGLESLPAVSAVVAGDLEGDGDLDLVVALSGGRLKAMINRGNRTFFEAPIGASTVSADDTIVDLAIGDLDRDIDLDVVTIHRSGKVGLLENLLHLQFRLRYLDQVPALPVTQSDDSQADASLSVAIEDVDSNAGWDVIATSSDQVLVAFANSSDIGVWTVDRVETGQGFSTRPVLADFDNDSYLELLGPDQIVRLGPWGVVVLTASSPIASERRLVAGCDVNADGHVDLVSLDKRDVWVGLNQDESGHHVTVRFKGIADNAASSGRVNHYGIGSVLELRFGPYYRSRIVTGPETHFGIDGIEAADTVRVIMPNGLTQTIRQVPIDSLVEEEQTLKGSCPYLYAWDGEKFAFVTDCLWAAPLGLQVASGVVQKDRPWEYLKVDGDLLAKNPAGNYELRLTEELWEVAYVDQIELIAVDHPESVDIFTNEKVGPPTIAKPTVYAFGDADLCPLNRAVDTKGVDVTATLASVDETYVQGFDRRIRQGLCPPHWIDVDFGEMATERVSNAPDASVYLVLTGWILPTDTSLNIQIDQNPELPPIEFPSVWVPDSDQPTEWRQVIEFMGFPGGKTKTIVVDVTEHLRAEDPRLRIRTSAQIYWDAASLAVQPEEPGVDEQPLHLVDAEVAYHGFSRKIKPDETRPERYDYSRVDDQPMWPPLRGSVTQFGPCSDQLTAWDDSMVVISGGDEIRMTFSAPQNDPPPGWRRDFVLHCVGWDKDADLNTLTGQSIGPLPIRDMRSYPPTAASADQFRAVEQMNSETLRRRQAFRGFWRRGGGSEKPFLSTGPGE